LPGLGGGQSQRLGMDLQRGAGDGGALVGRPRGVAQHHVRRRHGHVEFFGHDLRPRGEDAGAQINVAIEAGDRAVVPHRQQQLGALGRVAGHGQGLARCGRPGGGGSRQTSSTPWAAK